jgi:hypothetical protein
LRESALGVKRTAAAVAGCKIKDQMVVLLNATARGQASKKRKASKAAGSDGAAAAAAAAAEGMGGGVLPNVEGGDVEIAVDYS